MLKYLNLIFKVQKREKEKEKKEEKISNMEVTEWTARSSDTKN